MVRVLFFLFLTAAAMAAIVFTAWTPELWEPWLAEQGIARDSATFRSGLKALLAIVLGVPLTALIHAIGRLGSDRATTDIHGYTVLRLRAGMLWFCVVSCLFLAAMFFAYPMVDPATPAPWAFQAVGTVCLLAIVVFLKARVRYDKSTLTVSNNFGGSNSFHWSDLTDLRDVPELKHYALTFSTGKTAKIAYHYTGLDGLIDTARARLSTAPRRNAAPFAPA